MCLPFKTAYDVIQLQIATYNFQKISTFNKFMLRIYFYKITHTMTLPKIRSPLVFYHERVQRLDFHGQGSRIFCIPNLDDSKHLLSSHTRCELPPGANHPECPASFIPRTKQVHKNSRNFPLRLHAILKN